MWYLQLHRQSRTLCKLTRESWPWMPATPIRQSKAENEGDAVNVWAWFQYSFICILRGTIKSPLTFSFCPPGTHGEIRLLAENGQPGEDVEETMVCSKKQTNHVLQVSGESLGWIYSCVEAQGKAAELISGWYHWQSRQPWRSFPKNVLPKSFMSDSDVQPRVSS